MIPSKRLGALTIGQSPRPDLVAPLHSLLPQYEIVEAGALDPVAAADLPSIENAQYPLTTRLRTGELVYADARFLQLHLQNALDVLERQGVVATILLCAGTFSDLVGVQPLFKPFDIACATLQALSLHSIGIISPIVEQELPIKQRWLAANFQPTVWTASIKTPDLTPITQKANRCDAVVLDYVGHAPEDVVRLQQAVTVPVVDLGLLTMKILESSLS
ncbi:MAG: AroM family protein [Chloroflexota bacterium]